MKKLFLSTALAMIVAGPAYAQSNPANPGGAPYVNQYGCPISTLSPSGIICAGPGNTGNFPPTGDGSIGATRLWSRSNIVAGGTVPTVSACGTTPSMLGSSTDMSGTVNMGSGSPVACTVTFGAAYNGVPHVFIELITGTSAVHQTLAAVGSFTVTFASSPGASGAKFNYFVVGQSD